MTKSAVHTITDALPAEAVCERLNVMPRSIRLARERNIFPASWYREIRALCDENGLECPDDAFNWKIPSDNAPLSGADCADGPLPAEKHANAPADVQGAER